MLGTSCSTWYRFDGERHKDPHRFLEKLQYTVGSTRSDHRSRSLHTGCRGSQLAPAFPNSSPLRGVDDGAMRADCNRSLHKGGRGGAGAGTIHVEAHRRGQAIIVPGVDQAVLQPQHHLALRVGPALQVREALRDVPEGPDVGKGGKRGQRPAVSDSLGRVPEVQRRQRREVRVVGQAELRERGHVDGLEARQCGEGTEVREGGPGEEEHSSDVVQI
jgi:hypothetical protein